jgi:alpha,alpha-trehalase
MSTSTPPSPSSVQAAVLRVADIDAVVFDMDGVVTDTASVHAAAWKRLFDGFLAERARREGTEFVPFEDEDYIRDVDGKPRYDGVRSFLASRGIVLPEGELTDPGIGETVAGLGNRKDEYFLASLRRDGVRPYETTVGFVRRLQTVGVRTAVISASRNMTQVLAGAGLADLFETRVDGIIAERLGIPGKPDPAVFLEAARRLGVIPDRTAIVEDALAGAQAGRVGGFRLVIGVDRRGEGDALRRAGADVVVNDLVEVEVQA